MTRFIDQQRDALARHLRKYTTGEVRFDESARKLYATDASIYQIEPLGVFLPRTVADLVACVQIASEARVSLTPRGGGTSLSGQSIGPGIILDCSKYLNAVLDIDREARVARVQPGVGLDTFNRILGEQELQFGPDVSTSSRANLGGMMGNNSAGSHSIIYGKTIDHVLEMDVVLSSGERRNLREIKVEDATHMGGLEAQIAELVNANRAEIERRYPKIMRRVSGYNLDEFVRNGKFNLCKLVVGSEGTLATVHQAKVLIEPRPAATAVLVVHFTDIVDAIRASDIILPLHPSAIELVDDTIINLARSSLELSRQMDFVQGQPAALLVVEFYGESETHLRSKLDQLEAALLRSKTGYGYVRAFDQAEQTKIWKVRKAGLGLLLGMKGDRKPIAFIEDCAVEPARFPEFFVRFRDIIHKRGTSAGYYGHTSVGCLHIRPLINTKDGKDIRIMQEMTNEIADLVIEFGGGMSGEHGDGLARSYLNEKLFGPQLYNVFRQVKAAFDPEGRMNPGKIVNAPPMTENLRYGTKYRTAEIKTHYDFSREGGFASAVELCNGAAVCRKKNEGTMCPSYMVTLEDRHSTRGRANLMREILSGKIPATEFTGQDLHDALDLCLECKGCKAECPSNVDLAKLKYEFLAHYNEANGIPLRSKMFAHIHKFSRMASRWPAMANFTINNTIVKSALERFVGIDSRRKLPVFAKKTFESWFNARKSEFRNPNSEISGKVVLFHDTFINYNYPDIGKAATQLLEAAGYEVQIAERKCCGRPMISKGLPEEARSNAKYNVQQLHSWVEKGFTVVGCEPSCIFTFRDEYPDLLKGDEVIAVARSSFLLEEFIVNEKQAGRWKLEFKRQPKKALIHGHCHEKALIGSRYLKEAIALAYAVEEIDSGCCGMAGSFGYEKEHYDISMAIGRRCLFPAVEKNTDALVIAPGISCRQQVEHATGRRPLHPAEALVQAL
jgi:FAD/FMN-containing dehydrogenase/Fe-S oxidoreductase